MKKHIDWSRGIRSLGCLAGLAGWMVGWTSEVGGVAADEATPGATLSPGAVEVVRLAEAAVDEAVLQGRVEAAATPFALTADDILYLQDVGIAPELITAMLRRDVTLREQAVGSAPTATVSAPIPSVPPTTPPPTIVTNPPADVVLFHAALAPYGTWVDLEDLGWCWQPCIVRVDPLWCPYWQGGQWIWSDHGWYWHSYYSWGWAPFHYGRWDRHPRHGWLWFPDRTWGPAWVCWRQGDTHCGWAPLPRGARFEVGQGWRHDGIGVSVDFDFHLGVEAFHFVGLAHLCDRHPSIHGVPMEQLREMHRRSLPRNPEFRGPSAGWHVAGAPVGRVSEAWGRAIQPVVIQEVTSPPRGAIRRDRVVHQGAARVIHRPQLRGPLEAGLAEARRIDAGHRIPPPALPLPREAARRIPRGTAPGIPPSVPSPPLPGRRPEPPASAPHPPPSRPPIESPKGRELRQWREPRMVRPPPANPTPANPTPVNPTPVNPTPVNPTPGGPSASKGAGPDRPRPGVRRPSGPPGDRHP